MTSLPSSHASATTDALVIVAKYPEPGAVKTRLAALIGAKPAADLYRAFLGDLAQRFGAAQHQDGYALRWACAPGKRPPEALRGIVGCEGAIFPQRGNDFADRLYAIARDVRAAGYRRLVVISSDSPHLPASVVKSAFGALDTADVALGPAEDGGYYLIGLTLDATTTSGEPPDLFRGIQMSTATVCAETLDRAKALGLSVKLLASTFDIDETPDLGRLWVALRHADERLAPRTRLSLAGLLTSIAPHALLPTQPSTQEKVGERMTTSIPVSRFPGEIEQRREWARLGQRLPLPTELYIESTSRCNEACDQCPRTHLGREQDRDISLAEVRQIVEQIPTLRRVVLHGLGEPLMNRELPEIVSYLRGRGVYTLFNSNALLLNEARGRALIAAGLNELRVSMDGASPETYARVRGVNQKALPHILRNLAAFERLKTELGAEEPRTSLWFTAMRENIEELPQLVDIAAHTGVREVYVQRFIYFGKGLATEDQAIFRHAKQREQELIAETSARCAAMGVRFTATGASTPAVYIGRGAAPQTGGDRPWAGCHRPYMLAYITAHGSVYSCCFAPFHPGPRQERLLGNALEQSFDDIWNGDRYREFRSAFESDSPWSQCAGCGVKWSL